MTDMLDPFEVYVVDSEEEHGEAEAVFKSVVEEFDIGEQCYLYETECEACQ